MPGDVLMASIFGCVIGLVMGWLLRDARANEETREETARKCREASRMTRHFDGSPDDIRKKQKR